jgi:hypothetical protein
MCNDTGRLHRGNAKKQGTIIVELEIALLDCGFNEMDAKIIAREFLSGVANLAEAMGGGADQKVGEVLTNDQAIEILSKSLDDRLAAMPQPERARINVETLRRAFGYR